MPAPQFTLYSHIGGKLARHSLTATVAFVLKALGLNYETKYCASIVLICVPPDLTQAAYFRYLDFAKQEQKAPEFTKLNPNGRNFTLWESNAIILYLVDFYDTENKLTVTDPKEKAILNQYLYFQGTGQGPYYGQGTHFKVFAPEKIPYAINRYSTEVERVISVLDTILSNSTYLVGNKLTIADLAFVTWDTIGVAVLLPEGLDVKTKYPSFWKWHESLNALPYVKSVFEEKAALSH